jgi:hypothetical protein
VLEEVDQVAGVGVEPGTLTPSAKRRFAGHMRIFPRIEQSSPTPVRQCPLSPACRSPKQGNPEVFPFPVENRPADEEVVGPADEPYQGDNASGENYNMRCSQIVMNLFTFGRFLAIRRPRGGAWP